MTEQARDNTLWNVIEVETAHNVPQSAKLVLSAVKYADLPLKVAEYRASLSGTDPHYGKGEVEDFANRLRDRWNQEFEWEQGKDNLDGYWMGSSAFDHWHTSIPRKPPTCALQVSHYLFFQRVEAQEVPSQKTQTETDSAMGPLWIPEHVPGLGTRPHQEGHTGNPGRC